MRIIPPIISAFFPNLFPVFLPIKTPVMATKKVVNPIIMTAANILTLINAKLMPTTNASMLVAIAIPMRTKSLSGLKEFFSLHF